MEVQCYAMNARQEGSLSNTFVSWDEFRKFAKVGDTIREPSRTLTIYEKVYELTASGDQFAIQLYAR
ncbi:hypothetical protein N4P55_26280 [Pseudomonas fluorescens]|uniref:hypothetical protein n=1 Tax=Pseudomonas fluorescens TaxID=294 RepID=UPI0021D3CAD9|nr:hypothetical protein [Pseudomonas fluorescens]UXV19330.1 hypothetical protein N4P55_26280 [Pseudomonas fluorescens]